MPVSATVPLGSVGLTTMRLFEAVSWGTSGVVPPTWKALAVTVLVNNEVVVVVDAA